MNNEEMLERAKTLTAKANGVECEKQWKQGHKPPWKEWYSERYDPITFRYRIKPEPEPVVNEWWVNFYPHSACGLHATPEKAEHYARPDATEVAVKVVRADSIEIADLVTYSQMEEARVMLVEWGLPIPTAYEARKLFEALDKVREAADEN